MIDREARSNGSGGGAVDNENLAPPTANVYESTVDLQAASAAVDPSTAVVSGYNPSANGYDTPPAAVEAPGYGPSPPDGYGGGDPSPPGGGYGGDPSPPGGYENQELLLKQELEGDIETQDPRERYLYPTDL